MHDYLNYPTCLFVLQIKWSLSNGVVLVSYSHGLLFIIFTYWIFSNSLKNSNKQKGEARRLKEQIERKAVEKKMNLGVNPPTLKARNKKVVAKTFHKMGIVVPLDENGVGYRDLQISNGKRFLDFGSMYG